MPTLTFSRSDVLALCDRLDARAWSPLAIEMPMLQRDLREASALLRSLAEHVTVPLKIDIFNGTI